MGDLGTQRFPVGLQSFRFNLKLMIYFLAASKKLRNAWSVMCVQSAMLNLPPPTVKPRSKIRNIASENLQRGDSPWSSIRSDRCEIPERLSKYGGRRSRVSFSCQQLVSNSGCPHDVLHFPLKDEFLGISANAFPVLSVC